MPDYDQPTLPMNYYRRMRAARLLMSAAQKLIGAHTFSHMDTATAIGDIYAAFEALGMADHSDDEMTRNYHANPLTAADEVRENLREVER